MENNLVNMLNVENAKTAANEIVNSFIENGTEETIEMDYQITLGKASSCEANTVYRFNFAENSVLYNISSVAKKIEELSSAEHDALLNFEMCVATEINNYFPKIKDKLRNFTPIDHDKLSKIDPKIRSKILEAIFPMDNSSLLSCLFNFLFDPDGDSGYTLNIYKSKPSTSTTSLANDLEKRHTATGKSFEEIIKEQKEIGNDQYKYVMSAVKKYYEAQCQLSFHINYNPAPKEEVDKKVEQLFIG